jgi:uncharacterized protein (TIGR03435 family)
MKIARLAFVLGASTLSAQTPVPTKVPAPPASTEPLIVDVHSSPYRSAIYYSMNIGHQRYDMRDATILDMIEFAYDREGDAIIGGPTWIDFDRFDVVARVDSLNPPGATSGPPDPAKPPPNSYDKVRPILKQVLTDRFHFTYHTEDRPLPGYIVTVAKEGLKLADAKNATEPSNCKVSEDKPTEGQATLICTSETVEQLLATFRGAFPHPAVDHTGLKKPYDFTLKLVYDQLRTREEYTKLYVDAFARLGLIVTPGTVPQPAIVVDHVDRPTANPPNIAKLIPAIPDLEFEVATIRPAAPDEPLRQIRPTGSQITFTNFTLQELLTRAWQFPTGAMLGNRPPWLTVTKYSILVKLPPDIDGRVIFQNQDQLDNMLQKLLIDRFQIKYHWGEQTQDGAVLLAGTPKMKKADPNSRSACNWGPPEGEKNMAAAGSPFDAQFHCQNVTMAQLADVLQSFDKDDVKNHVQDKTGLAGSYDFTVYYTSLPKLRADAVAAAAAAQEAGANASEPLAGMSSAEALRKQLGLRLEKQPITSPALILDHIEQKPTEN